MPSLILRSATPSHIPHLRIPSHSIRFILKSKHNFVIKTSEFDFDVKDLIEMGSLFSTFGNLTPDHKLLLAITMVTSSLMATTYTSIPFLFFRPKFLCLDPSTNQMRSCPEAEACSQTPLKYESQYSFSSISIELQLFCQNKITETNILTLMMVGHLLGSVFSLYMSKMGGNLRTVLTIMGVAISCIGLGLFSLFFTNNPIMIGVILALWAFMMDILNCFNYLVPPLAFGKHKEETTALSLTAWPCLSIILPEIYWMFSSWKVFLVTVVAVPNLVVGALIFWKLEAFLQPTPYDDDKKLSLLPEETNTPTEMNFRDILQSSGCRNILLFIFTYSGNYVSYMSCVLYLSSLVGNIYVNLTLVSLVEFAVCVFTLALIKKVNKRALLQRISTVIAAAFLTYSFFPSTFQSLIVIVGKVVTDSLWILQNLVMYEIVPKQFIPVVYASKGCFNLLISSVMPYMKYGMEMIGSTIFPLSGVYFVMVWYGLKKLKSVKEVEEMERAKELEMTARYIEMRQVE